MTEASRAFAGEHGAMNNWDKIWKKRTAKIENRATVFEMFKELKRADGFDTQDVQGYYEAFFLQWECMAQRIETGCAGTIGSLYEIGCGSGVNLYLFSALKHVAVLGGLDYSKNLIRIAQSVVPEADVGCEDAEKQLEKSRNADFPTIQFEALQRKQKAGNVDRESLAMGNSLEILAEELPVEVLIPLLYGNTGGISSNLGAAGIKVPGSAGETSEALYEKYGVPVLIMADGPAGIRLQRSYEVNRENDSVYGIGVLGSLENGFLVTEKPHQNADTYYQYCTAFPVGTALAQSWNRQLLKEFGEMIAEEMEKFGVNLWLAPGMNIHRNPLCGRNFEYYSEDPLLAGSLAAAVTKGVQSKAGCGVTIKHFACNNQEDNRMGVDVHLSERALREIYCRGFEIAIKESKPVAIMSSYNLVNGVHAANSKDLCTRIVRDEWGFEGVIMSDWNTTEPKDGSIPWKCTAAGNDIIMPGSENDHKSILDGYRSGELSEEEIRICARRVLKLIDKLRSSYLVMSE